MSAGVKEGHQYALDVVAGEIMACKWIILACKRYLSDLERDDIYFDVEDAQHHLDFYPQFCVHVKGKLEDKPIELEPWQAFGLMNIFGWKMPDGLRRFRTAYEEVARKNAKSTKLSGVGLYMLGFDNEGGAEVYSAATTRDQAKIVFEDAKVMGEKSPHLRRVFGFHRNNIHLLKTASKFEPLSSDADTLDGKNVHCGLIDEVHAHKSRDVWDVVETATGAREQPLMYAITTSGTNKQGICYELREYLCKILEGLIQDDTFFGLIFTLDKEDDWTDESVWIKANPNLGISKKWDDMRRLAKKAKEIPTARNNFLTKHLNIWVNAAVGWMNMEKWDRAPKPEPEEVLQQLPCFIGMDLANKLDIAAVVIVVPDSEGHLHVKCKFYLPEEQIHVKARSIGNMYQSWADDGYITLTDGNIIDHEYIEDDVREILSEWDVKEIGFDPWGSTQLSIRLSEDGAPMVEVGQTVKNLSEAMKEVEALVHAGKLHHGDNPVLNWMASNVTAKEDKNENVFPNKEHKDNKIDGMVAMFMAVNRYLCHGDDDPGLSKHLETHGIRTL